LELIAGFAGGKIQAHGAVLAAGYSTGLTHSRRG